MKLAHPLTCVGCGHRFSDDESAWAQEVKRADLETGAVTLETRLTCDDCAVA